MDKVIDIVLVTYRPDGRLPDILRMLREQKMPPRQVHLINTEKSLFDEALSAIGTDEQKLCRQYPFLDIIHIISKLLICLYIVGTINLGKACKSSLHLKSSIESRKLLLNLLN